MKYSVQQQIHFNGNVFGNKCCHRNEGSLCVPFLSISAEFDCDISSFRRGGFGGGSWGFRQTPFDLEFHFHEKVWINLINWGYLIYPKYLHPFHLPYTSLQQVHFNTTCEYV